MSEYLNSYLNESDKYLFSMSKSDEKFVLIAQMPSTRRFTTKEKHTLSAIFHQRFYDEHEEIYPINSPAAAAYYVIDGSVGIFRSYDSRIPERIAYIRPTQWFGCSALVKDKNRDSSARALEKTSCFILFKTDFMELKNNDSQCALQLLSNICCDLIKNLQETQNEYFTLTGKLARANMLV
jgi:signal-transduction protein with cAMP-binding, CBS, and nucleotidyltransferase domain